MSEPARAHCPVCCGDLVSQVVFCSRCNTPHHDECWEFSGRCAIYGCSSQQFTTSSESAEPATLAIDGADEFHAPTPLSPRLPEPATENEDARFLAGDKRRAFRTWLRDLIDEGISAPRLWMNAPAAARRMALYESEDEYDGRRTIGLIVKVQLALLPFVLLLAWLGEGNTNWLLTELGAYLGLTFLLHLSSREVERALIVDSQQDVKLSRTLPGVGWVNRRLGSLRGIAAVALLAEFDQRNGCAPGIVLLDAERRPIAIPYLQLPAARVGEPQDADVRLARSTARFLGVVFAGVMDGFGRRRRLPPSDGTAPS